MVSEEGLPMILLMTNNISNGDSLHMYIGNPNVQIISMFYGIYVVFFVYIYIHTLSLWMTNKISNLENNFIEMHKHLLFSRKPNKLRF